MSVWRPSDIVRTKPEDRLPIAISFKLAGLDAERLEAMADACGQSRSACAASLLRLVLADDASAHRSDDARAPS